MKLVDTDETVLIVTGSGLGPEERDRPLAYWLKEQVDRRGGDAPFRRAVVVSDLWYAENRVFHLNPAIAVGGPGVNGAAREFSERLPLVLREDDRVFVQAALDEAPPRVALWGMDTASTAEAVERFVTDGLLEALLARLWRSPRDGTALA